MPLTPPTIPTEYQYRALLIPDDLYVIGAVYGALLYLADIGYWQAYGAVSPEDIAYRMLQMIFESADMGDVNLIGTVIGVVRDPLPANMLYCDGSTYNRVDYPRLYAMLDSAFVVDADTFTVPDLQGRVLVGVGAGLSTYTVNQFGGEESHTLTTGEIPSHTHSDLGHTHAESTATPTVVTIGAGAPTPSAIPGVGITGSGNASLANTGGDGSHNNIQPFRALKYAVIAR